MLHANGGSKCSSYFFGGRCFFYSASQCSDFLGRGVVFETRLALRNRERSRDLPLRRQESNSKFIYLATRKLYTIHFHSIYTYKKFILARLASRSRSFGFPTRFLGSTRVPPSEDVCASFYRHVVAASILCINWKRNVIHSKPISLLVFN